MGKFNKVAEGAQLLQLLQEVHGPIPEQMPKFVAWAQGLCRFKRTLVYDCIRDPLYQDLLTVNSTREQWMSQLPHARHNAVEAKLLTLFPNRASLACGVSFSHEHLQQAVVTLVVLHCRLELFGETVKAAEAA